MATDTTQTAAARIFSCLTSAPISIVGQLQQSPTATRQPSEAVEVLREPLPREEKSAALQGLTEVSRTYKPGTSTDGFLYAVGAVVAAYTREVSCEVCESSLTCAAPSSSFIQVRKYEQNSNLTYPAKLLSHS